MPPCRNSDKFLTFKHSPYLVRARTNKTTNWDEVRRDLAKLQIPGFPSTDVFRLWNHERSTINEELNNCQQPEPDSSTHPSSSLGTSLVRIEVRNRQKTTNLSDSDSKDSYSKFDIFLIPIPEALLNAGTIKPEEPEPEPILPPTYDVSIRKTSFRKFAENRLIRDVEELWNEIYPGITATPTEDDIFLWTTSITGPEDSPYAGGVFQGFIQFTSEYPYVPPTLTFSSNIFHPNITETGVVCFNSYLNNWTPCFSLGAFLMAAQYLLGDPSTIEPANLLAATLFVTERANYNEIVKQCVCATVQTDVQVKNTPEASSIPPEE